MSGHRRSRAGAFIAGIALSALAFVAHGQDRIHGSRADVVVQALSLLGTPYRFGGSSPELGFDCSGLVRHVFASVLNRDLPRRSEEISGVGHPVSRAELQPGDLVFFDTLKRAFSHVAIYIGEGRFVHAPARNGRVRVEGLDDRYWAARFNGARRVMDAVPVASVASPTLAGHHAADSSASSLPSQLLAPDRPPGP